MYRWIKANDAKVNCTGKVQKKEKKNQRALEIKNKNKKNLDVILYTVKYQIICESSKILYVVLRYVVEKWKLIKKSSSW